MKHLLYLTGKYLVYHRWRTTFLVAALTLTVLLPLLIHLLINQYGTYLVERAEQTPAVAGEPGNRYDLVLNVLYFRTRQARTAEYGRQDDLTNTSNTDVIPIYNRFTARDFPVVGTDPAYFSFRDLELKEGNYPALLGDCVLGSEVASSLGKQPGDTLRTDSQNLVNLAGEYPLELNVTGVLETAGTPDDSAIFTDLRTTWVMEGIGHGHASVEEMEQDPYILEREGNRVVLGEGITGYQEITPRNVDTFHFHGNSDSYPVTGFLLIPETRKDRDLILAEYDGSDQLMILLPDEVIGELMNLVFRIQQFLNVQFLIILCSTGLFLALITMLIWRIREPEMQTLYHIGASRTALFLLHVLDVLLILMMSLLLALLLSGIGVLLMGFLDPLPFFLM